MSEKFDFSKIEDRNKFEKLPEKERKEIIGAAQEESFLIKEVVGEKGTKEDYEMATKLVEEEIISKNRESLGKIFEQRLNDILRRQLTVENIETFTDDAITQTIHLAHDIVLQYRNNIEVFDTELSKREQEDRAFLFFELPNITEILESIIEKKEQIDKLKKYLYAHIDDIDEIITPPSGTREATVGNGQWIEQKRMFPRMLTLLYILENDFDVLLEDVLMVKGIVTPDMMRQTPYMRIEIPDLERVVYLCDEEGNVSYVFDTVKIYEQNITLEQLDIYSKEAKNSLISRCPGIGIRIRQAKDWRDNISLALGEPISEKNISKDRVRESEFEKKAFLSFEDFQNEVRKIYPGKGDVFEWYRKEYKKHKGWPAAPYRIYKDKGWQRWPELVEKSWPPFEDFQSEVRKIYPGKGDVFEWYRQEYKKHKGWPARSDVTYKDKGWQGWPELVGKENRLKKGNI